MYQDRRYHVEDLTEEAAAAAAAAAGRGPSPGFYGNHQQQQQQHYNTQTQAHLEYYERLRNYEMLRRQITVSHQYHMGAEDPRWRNWYLAQLQSAAPQPFVSQSPTPYLNGQPIYATSGQAAAAAFAAQFEASNSGQQGGPSQYYGQTGAYAGGGGGGSGNASNYGLALVPCQPYGSYGLAYVPVELINYYNYYSQYSMAAGQSGPGQGHQAPRTAPYTAADFAAASRTRVRPPPPSHLPRLQGDSLIPIDEPEPLPEPPPTRPYDFPVERVTEFAPYPVPARLLRTDHQAARKSHLLEKAAAALVQLADEA